MKRQVARFLSVGILNTAIGFGTIILLKELAGWGDVAANVGGYGVGLIVSFALNGRWTFGYRGAWSIAAVRFLLVFAVAYTVNIVLMLALRDVAHLHSYAAHAGAMVAYTVVFFIGSRLFAFARSTDTRVQT